MAFPLRWSHVAGFKLARCFMYLFGPRGQVAMGRAGYTYGTRFDSQNGTKTLLSKIVIELCVFIRTRADVNVIALLPLSSSLCYDLLAHSRMPVLSLTHDSEWAMRATTKPGILEQFLQEWLAVAKVAIMDGGHDYSQ
eukprot:649044-Amphidinium_carterae.1